MLCKSRPVSGRGNRVRPAVPDSPFTEGQKIPLFVPSLTTVIHELKALRFFMVVPILNRSIPVGPDAARINNRGGAFPLRGVRLATLDEHF